MGLFDSLLPGRGPAYKPSPVPVEGVVGIWTGANTRGGLSMAGGQVVLTRDYLIFTPWDLDQTRAWLVKWLGKAGAPQAGKVDDLLTKSKLLDAVAIPLSHISGVQVLNRASLLKPPTARIQLEDGSHFDLGILASPLSANISKANNSAQDDWLSKMPVRAA